MKEFKIRCSAISQIMASPSANKLPVGAITYIHTWLKEQIYSRSNQFSSKYTEKGTECEQGSIELAAEEYGWGMVAKNTEMYEDEYMTGTPDLILADEIPDIKNAWSCFTFPLFDTEMSKEHYWQLQGYMRLARKPKACIIHTLMDAPESLIMAEARKEMYRAGLDDLEMELYDQVKASMTYSHLPNSLRIKRFDTVRDDEKIEQIINRVKLCREYIQNLNLNYANSNI